MHTFSLWTMRSISEKIRTEKVQTIWNTIYVNLKLFCYMAHQLYLCFIFVASSDLVIPAHTTVIIGTFKLHRRPDIYPNPDQFNPDNFLPEKSASRHYYSFIPFSAGPRSCVGKYSKPNISILTLDCIIYKDYKTFWLV